MQITDPVADMLTRIRNANTAKHESVDVPASNLKKAIAKILLDEGYIKSYEVVEDGTQGVIRIQLKYLAGKEKVISGLRRVSKPGLRVYAGADELPRVLKGLGIAIISTSKGVMTDKAARRMPVTIPAGVEVSIAEPNVVTVKGPKGTLTQTMRPEMIIKVEGNVIHVGRPSEDKLHKSLHGLTRSLIHDMVVGVTDGFKKELEINGVGYKASKEGKKLVINGIDKQKVGQFAANVRGKRPPEPYKGKGIKYATETIRHKEGKAGGKK